MTDIMYKLTTKLRKELSEPFGMLFEEPDAAKQVDRYLREHRTPLLIAVGDVVSYKLIRLGRFPHICIIDGYTKRGKYSVDWGWSGVIKSKIKNPPATISTQAFDDIRCEVALASARQSFRMNKSIIFVDGEEDLLVLPCIVAAPIGSVIVYGQPNVGIVLCKVTKKSKKSAEIILEKMKV